MNTNKEISSLTEKIKQVIFSVLILASIIFILLLMGHLYTQAAAIDAVNEGKVVDKQVSESVSFFSPSGFLSSSVKYQICVNVEYEIYGQTRTTIRTLTVPESTFFEINIGNYIDDLRGLRSLIQNEK